MPSLARKSMKFMRDVYNIAANPDGSSIPPVPAHSQGFKPSQGLSGQFNQTYTHQQPPLSAHPAYPVPSSYVYPYVAPHQAQPQPQPHGSWSVPPTPISPLSPQPEYSFPPTTHSSSNNIPAYGLPLSPSASLSPSTPQMYHQQAQLSAHPPPLPQRPSHHGHSSSWQGSSEPGWQSQSQVDMPVIAHSTHEYNPALPSPIQPFTNVQHMGPGSYHGQVESQSTRPPPPPLPPRIQAQNTDFVPNPAVPVSNSTKWPGSSHEGYGSIPQLSGTGQFGPSECYEMPAEPISDRPPIHEHQRVDISNLAELPASAHAGMTPPSSSFNVHTPTSGSTAGAVELPTSPIRHSSHDSTHQSPTSTTRPQGYHAADAEEVDGIPLTHRDLGVALPPSTLRSPVYLSPSQAPLSGSTTISSPTPSLQTPSTSSCPSEPAHDESHEHLQTRPSVHEPSGGRGRGRLGSRRTSAAALPYPEDNGPVMMPLHFDYTNRQGAMVETSK